MNVRAYKIIVVVLFCVAVWFAWGWWRVSGQTVWFDFIEKQCLITQDMIDHPPDGFVPEGLALRLEFLMGYYEAHRKSLAGSRLEAVAQRDYQQTLANAVALFRGRSTNDLGADPQAWIKKYGH